MPLAIRSVVFRTKKYYDDWLSGGGEPLKNVVHTFHCPSCRSEPLKINIQTDTTYLSIHTKSPVWSDLPFEDHGGLTAEVTEQSYRADAMWGAFVKCPTCDKLYAIVYGYNEHQPARDIIKLQVIFRLAVAR